MKQDEFTILTITLLVRHECGAVLTIHGDDWTDVHGVCVECDREFDLEFFPRFVEDEE